MAIRLIVTINAAPGKGSELAKVYPDRCADTMKEPGCEHFEAFQSIVNPDKIILLERWTDQAALPVRSPFNFALYARINTQDQVTGMMADQKITIKSDGQATREALQGAERVQFLVEHLGIAEKIVARLPADEPLPPPPGRPS